MRNTETYSGDAKMSEVFSDNRVEYEIGMPLPSR